MPYFDTTELESKQPLPGWDGRYFHSQSMTFAYYDAKAGSSIHEHSHTQEEVWHVLEGQLEVTIGNETRVAGPRCAAVVPSDTTHSVRALTDCRAIVVDYPIRKAVGRARTD